MIRPVNIFWFKRDLRLSGNPALEAAAASGDVVPLFIFDPRFARALHTPRGAYLAESVSALNALLDGTLVCRFGNPAQELTQLVRAIRATAAPSTQVRVFSTASHTAIGATRDAEVADALRSIDATLITLSSPYAALGEVVTAAGSLHRVFTPYKNRWLETVATKTLQDRPVDATFVRLPVPDPDDYDCAHLHAPRSQWHNNTPVGEIEARTRRDAFLADPVERYAQARDVLALDGTSRLGAALHVGAIHPLQIIHRLDLTDEGDISFASELCWRDFYAAWGAQPGVSLWEPMDRKFAHLPVDTDAAARARYSAWCQGRTGFPSIDAGMRQLAATGWMHNRARMFTASFLVKHLHLPWQWGARWLLDHLVDGDLTSNNLGFQWVAGCGMNASPFFRIFNPIKQGETYDPSGCYIRTWVPELADEPNSTIHQPRRLGTRRGAGAAYPSPIIDLDAERQEALARFEVLRA